MDYSNCLVLLILIIGAAQCGHCWPEGAPFKTCISRFPKHGSKNQQTSPSPYEILVSSTNYSTSASIQVTIRSVDGVTEFKGFQISARRTSGDLEESVGEWIPHPDSSATTRLQYWYPDKPGQFNCVTHRDKSDKTLIHLTWRASRDYGDVIFRAGLVKVYEIFWADVHSPVIRFIGEHRSTGLADNGQLSHTTPATISDPSSWLTTTGCGTTKGCLLFPHDCSGLDCDAAVTYHTNEARDAVEFKMIAISGGYISIGLSIGDEMMGEDDTVTCLTHNGGVHHAIQHGYSPQRRNDQHRNIDLSNVFIGYHDGRLFCSFTRPVVTSLTYIYESHLNKYENVTEVQKGFNLSDPFYVQLAWGPLYDGTSVIGKHTDQPLSSRSALNLLHHDLSYATGLTLSVKIHAVLAFLGWIVLSSSGMMIARHCRHLLSRSCIGSATWFQVHRSLMVLVFVVTATLIVIVFVSVGEWSKRAANHAIVGLVLVGLVLVQLVMGVLRPALNSPRRLLFNWAHRLLAVVCQCLAITTMILGVQLGVGVQRARYNLTTVIVVSVVLQTLYELALELLQLWVASKAAVDNDGVDVPGQLQFKDIPATHASPFSGRMKKCLLVIFVFSTIAELAVFSFVMWFV